MLPLAEQEKLNLSAGADSPKSEAILDARLATQQIGGSNEEVRLLTAIRDNTKKAADKEGGVLVGV